MAEWNPAAYVRRSALQESMATEVLALLRLTGSERVLDIGCGDGRITAEIAMRLPNGSILGVDASHDMIAFASAHAQQPNLRFAVGNGGELSYQNEFDLVVSFNALHWIADANAALRGIRAAMKANARGQLRLVPDGPRKSLETVIEETRRSANWASYFANFHDPYLHLSPNEYAQAAEGNGLHVKRLHTADHSWDFHSRENFFAFGQATFVEWTRVLPNSEKTAFIHDVLDRYQLVAADTPEHAHTFRFYQLDVTLTRA